MNTPGGVDPFAALGAAAATRTQGPPRPAGRPAVVPLPQAIRQWREAAISWVRVDDAETAGVLAARRPRTGPPRVVVVGETNRGKSSLLNALIGVPGASPVDAGVATCTYL